MKSQTVSGSEAAKWIVGLILVCAIFVYGTTHQEAPTQGEIDRAKVECAAQMLANAHNKAAGFGENTVTLTACR